MTCGSTTCTPSHTHSLRHAAPAPWHLPSPFGWFAGLVRWQASWRRRQELLELEDWLLRDIGLTREEVEREAHRPFTFPRHPRA